MVALPHFFAYIGAVFPDSGRSHSPLQGQFSANNGPPENYEEW
jgi:hypothetical protein